MHGSLKDKKKKTHKKEKEMIKQTLLILSSQSYLGNITCNDGIMELFSQSKT